jgi:hypothetical protein
MEQYTREDLFFSMCETVREPELSCTKVKVMTTEGTQNMIEKKKCLMRRIRRAMDEQNPELHMEQQCIIHQQSLCGKTNKSEHVMKVVVSVVNFI